MLGGSLEYQPQVTIEAGGSVGHEATRVTGAMQTPK